MSMSSHVVGYRPPDEEWRKMVACWNACDAAGVEVPQPVWDFFQGEPPEDKPGMEVELPDLAFGPWSDGESCEGFEVDVRKVLDAGITKIRFFNSW